MSQLMFWSKQNNNKQDKDKDKDNEKSTNGTSNETKSGKKNWLHTPEALMDGHVVYLVKFFGNLPVDQPKGIEVIKDVIRKLQFAQQMRKAETGSQEKYKKLEITISVDGVAIQEPRTQKILHQFPLHNISYCADEKGVKKFFSFIAKTVKAGDANANANGSISSSSNGFGSNLSSSGSTNGSVNGEESHECFVFISNKLASDITLTIGQAFELAYRKYINSTEKTDLGKAQQQIANLEKTLEGYKNRLLDIKTKIPRSDLDNLLFSLGIKDIFEGLNENGNAPALTNGISNSMNEGKLLIDTSSTIQTTKSTTSASGSAFAPTVPPRNNLSSQILSKSNSQKMDELLLNSDSDSDFDPRAEESLDSSGGSSTGKNVSNDLFGFEPPKSYGQQLFFNTSNNNGSTNSNNNNNNTYHSFTNEMNFTPPLLAPPPKVAAPRRTISTSNTNSTNNNNINNNNNSNNNQFTDFFGTDPFVVDNQIPFKPKQTINIDDFSLESLDPLRK